MVTSGSCKHRYIKRQIQGRIRQVLTWRYTEASSSFVYSIICKDDSATLANAFETLNRLSIDHYIFWKKKGDQYQIPPNKPYTDRYSPTKK